MTEFINILIGGLQENQSIKTDGICTTITASCGCGGGYVPLIVLKITKEEKDGNVQRNSKLREIISNNFIW